MATSPLRPASPRTSRCQVQTATPREGGSGLVSVLCLVMYVRDDTCSTKQVNSGRRVPAASSPTVRSGARARFAHPGHVPSGLAFPGCVSGSVVIFKKVTASPASAPPGKVFVLCSVTSSKNSGSKSHCYQSRSIINVPRGGGPLQSQLCAPNRSGLW